MAEEVKTSEEQTAAPAPEQSAGTAGTAAAKVTFTEEQQEHIDKLIATYHAKSMAKVEAKAAKKLEELKEAERLKSLSAEDRAAAELDAARTKIAEFERQQLVSQFKVELTEKGLPAGFADYIAVADADAAKAALDFLAAYKTGIEKDFTAKISELETELRNASLRGVPPKSTGGAAPSAPLTLEQAIAQNISAQVKK